MSAEDGAPATASVDVGAARVTVEVAYSPGPGRVDRVSLQLPADARVADALRLSAIADRHPALRETAPAIGVWGRRCTLQQPLRDGDRVEIYRPLRVDPKDARRERQRRDGGALGGKQKRRSGATADLAAAADHATGATSTEGAAKG